MEFVFIRPNGEKISIYSYREDLNMLMDDYFDLLSEYNSYEELCLLYTENQKLDYDELKNIIWKTDDPKYILVEKKKVKCSGCEENIANQEGHMDFGGCLNSL